MSNRTWNAVHRRGEVLRAVVEEANARRDGVLPMELPGVAETFGDEFNLIAALQLRWHTRLAGRIERALMEQPMDLESAVLSAWRGTATELVGVRQILDAYSAHPTSEKMADALRTSHRKDWTLMAAMAGRAGVNDDGAERVGRALEEKARVAYDPAALTGLPRHRADTDGARNASILNRLKAHLAA